METIRYHPDDVECPVCRDIMEAPIWSCKVGHNFCDDCKKKLTICPLCRGEMMDQRNHALEDYGSKLTYKCTNEFDGCDYQADVQEIKKHNKFCQYTTVECPLMCIDGCNWTGKIHEIMSHCQKNHPSNAYSAKSQKLICKNFLELQDENTMTLKHYYMLFEVNDKLFKVTWDLNCSTGFIMWRVIYFGPDEGALHYRFSVDFENPMNGKDKLRLEGHCQPLNSKAVNNSKMFVPTMQAKLIRYCLDMDLHYTISIFKVEEEEIDENSSRFSKWTLFAPEGSFITIAL